MLNTERTSFAWAVYDHPTDYPEFYVARRWLLRSGKVLRTDMILKEEDVEVLRYKLLEQGLTKFPRHEQDDPKIMEIWL